MFYSVCVESVDNLLGKVVGCGVWTETENKRKKEKKR